MLIEGSIKTDKTDILINEYVKLVDSGVSPEQIVVICLNSFKKEHFLNEFFSRTKSDSFSKPYITTFFGICYNSVLDNFPLFEAIIKQGNTAFLPNLCGLELSRFLLEKSVELSGFKDYFSKTNLLHQLFRRIALCVSNDLTEAEISEKSDILKESFKEDAKNAYNIFRQLTLKYRSFDYLRQVSVLPFIYKNTDYFKKFKYIFVDDADEMTFAEFSFLQYIKPNIKEFFIAYDKNGASRCGFLSAYKTAVFEFEKLTGEKPLVLPMTGKMQEEADILFCNIISGEKSDLSSIRLYGYIKRLDMLDAAASEIKKLINSGIKPSEIAVVTPVIDDMLKTFSRNSDFDFQIISGSEKPKDSKFLRSIFTVLKLIFGANNYKIEPAEIRTLLIDVLKIPSRYSATLSVKSAESGYLIPFEFNNPLYDSKYNELSTFIKNYRVSEKSFMSEDMLKIFDYLASFGIDKCDLNKFNFLLKEIKSFENAFGVLSVNTKNKIILQFQNGIISENAASPQAINEQAVIIATPQKIIDFEIKRKYHLWLDVSSDLWTMRDTGTLYNAWVFNREWNKPEFTFEDNMRLSREKSARMLRKLMLCAEKNIYGFLSVYDTSGGENFGLMPSFFEARNGKKLCPKSISDFVPRKDQKPVADYKGGTVAVNAVPGAGKTAVLTALIIKLIKSGVLPSNIFVLTYMESAASTIKARIKAAFPNLNDLPNISTIHGLAFRIIKENNNYTHLNLPDNIEVCDDNLRQKLLREAISVLNLSQDEYDNYDKSISAVKLSACKIKSLKSLGKSGLFAKLFQTYETLLRKNSVLDYDDMLRFAVKILDENKDAADYYAGICEFVIEDEAQDSSELQQKLLHILSSKHGNLLRCGDINQSITSTFTDSDPAGFKKFFLNNKHIEMRTSQRNSVPIQIFANKFVKYVSQNQNIKDAFYPSEMQPADNNPETDKSPELRIFESDTEEKFFILNKIREILALNPGKSVAVLLRNNFQAARYHDFLRENGLKVTTRTDVLKQKTVFTLIYSLLKFVLHPFDNKAVVSVMQAFSNCAVLRFEQKDYDFVQNLKIPFLTLSADDTEDENILRLWWELNFAADMLTDSPDVFVTEIALRYFKTSAEKSNGYLIALIVKRLSAVYDNYDTVVEKLGDIAEKPLGSAYGIFDNEDASATSDVRIMTLHKSKGDEFDFVFIPELSEENYRLTPSEIKLKPGLVQAVKELRETYITKTNENLQKEQAEENARLLYVGFTRAKLQLYLSCPKKGSGRKTITPSLIFDIFDAEDKC